MDIKFLQLNLWHGTLLDNALAFIKAEQPDIINFQEVFDGPAGTDADNWRYDTLPTLRRELDWLPYHSYAPSLADTSSGSPLPWGNATFSRFPLTLEQTVFYDIPFGASDVKNGDFARSPRNLMYCKVAAPGGPFVVANTHGIWGTDGEDNDRRLAMAATLLDTLQGESPLILSGDFNVNEGTETIGTLEREWHNPFAGELATSFNMRYKPAGSGYATAVVDFIFTSRDWRVARHFASDADVSDHLPLIAELSL